MTDESDPIEVEHVPEWVKLVTALREEMRKKTN